jgi:hypothetical protein
MLEALFRIRNQKVCKSGLSQAIMTHKEMTKSEDISWFEVQDVSIGIGGFSSSLMAFNKNKKRSGFISK